jgi:general secretion pathway protein H
MKTPRATDGYSLLEMLAVLAMLALAAALAFGAATSRRPGETVNGLGQKIVRLAAAQSLRAASSGQSAQVKVDVKNRWIAGSGSGPDISIPGRFKLRVLTGAELVEQGNIGTIEFYPDGSSSGGEIALEEDGGATRTVRINWLTGAITLSEEPRQ